MLVPLSIALAGLVTTKRVSYRGASYGATVVPATTPGRPALVLLPPIGVGIDRTFCRRLVDAWAEAAPGPANPSPSPSPNPNPHPHPHPHPDPNRRLALAASAGP